MLKKISVLLLFTCLLLSAGGCGNGQQAAEDSASREIDPSRTAAMSDSYKGTKEDVSAPAQSEEETALPIIEESSAAASPPQFLRQKIPLPLPLLQLKKAPKIPAGRQKAHRFRTSRSRRKRLRRPLHRKNRLNRNLLQNRNLMWRTGFLSPKAMRRASALPWTAKPSGVGIPLS